MRAVMGGCLALLLSLPAAVPQALQVATTDGLSLRLDAKGNVSHVSVAGKALPMLRTRGGFYVAEVSTGGDELVTNSSVEQDVDADGVPDGFSASSYWKRDASQARSGQWSMRCAVPGTQDVNAGSFGVTVPVEGGCTYLISLWLKSQGRAGRHPSSIGYAQQQDSRGQRTTEEFQHMMHGGVIGDTDWSPVSLLLTTRADTRRLHFRTDIYYGHGTLWADDFSCVRLQTQAQPFPTGARIEGAGIALHGADAVRNLAIDATWLPDGEMLRLAGQIRDTSGADRCLVVSYRVPVDAVGGSWCKDIVERSPIGPSGRHATTASWGRFGPWSIYPFSSVITADRSAALSMAVPMHPPQPFRLAYSAAEGLVAEWDLGLTPATRKFPQAAAFEAVFYTHDPEWGFRSAADRYYRLFPEYFTVRCPRQGNWYYADVGKLESPEDFGLMFNEMATADTIKADDERDYLTFSYTEPWGWWGWALGLHPSEDDPKAPVEEVMKRIGELSAAADGAPRQNPNWAARTIANSGVYGETGALRARGYVARWGGYNWALNPAPDAVPDGNFSRFKATYEWEIEPKLAMGVDGIYLDSIVGSWTTIPNYRRGHLEGANYPLTFSKQGRRPAQLGVWNQYEFVEHLSKDLHARGKLLMGNIFPWEWVFFNHHLDVLGHEVFGPEAPARLRAQRTLAYHKPYTWLMQLKPEVSAEARQTAMRQAMSYAILPNIVGGTRDPAVYSRFRHLFRKYMPTIIAMAQAGWEPITHATCATPGVTVERFGPSGQALFLSVRNDMDEPVEARVDADLKALGLPGLPGARRLPEGDSLATQGATVSLKVDALDVAVIRVPVPE